MSIRIVLKIAIKYCIDCLTTLSGYARINKKKCRIISVDKNQPKLGKYAFVVFKKLHGLFWSKRFFCDKCEKSA